MTKSHGNCGKIVHRLCSSCISSIGNLIGTPLSFPCQLRLGVVLRRLSLSPYKQRAYCSPFFFADFYGISTTLPLCFSQQFLAI